MAYIEIVIAGLPGSKVRWIMANLVVSMECSEHENRGWSYDDEPATIRVVNPSGEEGYAQEPGPLTWLNSARITTDPDDDAVHCVISIDDPRGGFEITVRRLPDGRIVLHLPYPEQSSAHMPTAELHPGTLVITDDAGKPVVFRDNIPDGDRELPSGAVVTFENGKPVRAVLAGEKSSDVAKEIASEYGFQVTFERKGGDTRKVSKCKRVT